MTLDFDGWRRRGSRYVHRGHSIFVQKGGAGGDGANLVCLHGFPTASWDWHLLWDRLCAAAGRVLAPDFIGFGWSAKPKQHAYSIFDQADLVEGLLRHEGVDQYRILAHDYGDTVAQELMARADERRKANDSSLVLDSVCLLNGGLFPETHRARPLQHLLLSPLGPLVARAMNRRSFGRSFSAIFGKRTQPTAAELDEFYELISYDGGARITPALLGYMPERRAHRERWVGALVNASIPVRLIDGLSDPVSGSHMVARYRELVVRADVVELPSIGHYPNVEAPNAVWAGYEDMLARRHLPSR